MEAITRRFNILNKIKDSYIDGSKIEINDLIELDWDGNTTIELANMLNALMTQGHISQDDNLIKNLRQKSNNSLSQIVNSMKIKLQITKHGYEDIKGVDKFNVMNKEQVLLEVLKLVNGLKETNDKLIIEALKNKELGSGDSSAFDKFISTTANLATIIGFLTSK